LFSKSVYSVFVLMLQFEIIVNYLLQKINNAMFPRLCKAHANFGTLKKIYKNFFVPHKMYTTLSKYCEQQSLIFETLGSLLFSNFATDSYEYFFWFPSHAFGHLRIRIFSLPLHESLWHLLANRLF
jgi:hypothetical protein